MTGRTHLQLGVIAGLSVAYITGASPIMCVAAGAIGGLLPDIDHPQSMISGYIPGSSLLLNITGVRHRGITHSILFLGLLTALWFVAFEKLTLPYFVGPAIMAGVISHIIADLFTPAGVQVLYPLPGNWKLAPWAILPRPFSGWISGIFETLVSAGAIVAIIGLSVVLWR